MTRRGRIVVAILCCLLTFTTWASAAESQVPAHLADSMQRRMADTFPQLRDTAVEHAWGGFIDISMNRAPDFGRLADVMHDSKAQQFQSVYYLQGFSGHGLALTGLAEC